VIPRGIEPDAWVWTEDRIAELTRLWDEGVKTAEIGQRMGCSKNAVIGKVQRLNLTARVLTRIQHRPMTEMVSELNITGCRYIKDDPVPLRPGMYCGAKPAAPEIPYCPTHQALCHIVTPPLKD